MESGHKVGPTAASRRRKVGVLFLLMGLLSGMLAVLAPTAGAVTVGADPTGSITGFEIEGNQVGNGHALDWEALVGSADLTIVTDDTLDSGLQGTSKENDPSGWVCNTGGANPPKANILKAAVHVRDDGADGPFLDLAFAREQGQGSSHVNFEFNQNSITNPCPHTGRTTGDLLLVIDFPGGSESGAVEVYLWDEAISADGEWVPNNSFPASKAASASNGSDTNDPNDIADYIFGFGTLTTRTFGEATIDLSAVFGNGEQGCVRFGEVNVRSRSSGESITSALQDRLPATPIDLSTCGEITVHKEDDAGNALAGATFGLWPAAETVPDVGSDGTRPDTGSIDTCTSLANGTCTFEAVDPGDYKVAELTPPAGYNIDPAVIDVTVAFRQTVNVATPFVDPRHTGLVEVTKVVTGDGAEEVDADELAGIRFYLTTDPGEDPVNTWPPPGDPAECTLDGSSFSCVIGPVVLGDYFVNEDPTTVPDGLTAGDKVGVTVDEDGETVKVDYENPINPIDINLEKAGPDTALLGDVITYTFDVTTTGEPLMITSLEEITEAPDFADRCDEAPLTGPSKSGGDDDEWLEVGETWRWTCQHLVTIEDATDNDGRLLQNKAEVTGEDSFGRDVSDDDTHVVTIQLPVAIDLDKTGDTIAHVGDTVTYEFSVTNVGGEDLLDVELTDPDCDEGTIVAGDNGDDDVLAGGTWDPVAEAWVGGEVWTFTCTRTLGPDDVVIIDGEDFALNLASVRGETEDGREATDTDPHEVEIITPIIDIDKVVDDDTPDVGQTVTFTYVVTNTGDTTLFDVEVVDDQLGPIGTIAELAPGESVTLTATMVVETSSPVRNVGTATGSDVLGKSVSDDDDATIAIVLPRVITPVQPAQLPRTGGDADRLILLSGVLLMVGGALLLTSGEHGRRARRRMTV